MSGLIWAGSTVPARSDDITIRFDELDAYARSGSPRARILAQRLARLRADRDEALQWSNPAIAYDREELEPFSEWQFTLQKSFLKPFSHSKHRDGWSDRLRAAEFRLAQDTSELLADLKTGYVLLRLLDAHLGQLDQIGEIVSRASRVAGARHSEGELSGVEKRLIQLAALALDASRRDALAQRTDAAAAWQAEIGVPPGQQAILVTPVTYQPVELESPDFYTTLLDGQSAIRSRAVLQQALSKQAEAAKPGLVPGFDLYIGYKHIEPVLDGWVAGVALSLPLFDRKSGAARRLEADRRIAENELEIYRTRAYGEITSLVRLIEDARPMLSSVSFASGNGASVINSLLVSYEEGRYTLESFLNAVQIEVSGTRGYYDQLYTYYENIFRLEALTGTEIVSFSSEESEGQ
jgi:hypothetical protein